MTNEIADPPPGGGSEGGQPSTPPVGGSQRWPKVRWLLVLCLLLLVAGSLLIPRPVEVPEGYESWDWWFRGLMAVIFLGVARRAGVRLHYSNRVPLVSLLMMGPILMSVVGAGLSIRAGLLRADLLWTVLVGSVLVGIGEEVLSRGLILNSMAARMPVVRAVLFSSLLFAALHLLSGSPDTALVPLCLGLGLGWIYVMSGRNLWLVIALHAIYDIAVLVPELTVLPDQLGVVGGMGLMMLGSVVLTVIGLIWWRGVRLEPAVATPASPRGGQDD